MKVPNPAASGNGATALQFHADRQRFAVPEPDVSHAQHETTFLARTTKAGVCSSYCVCDADDSFALGKSYPGNGEQAFGFIIIFGVISIVAALVIFFIGTLTQIFLRKRTPRYTVIADLILFALFTGVLVYAGVTARYSDNAAYIKDDR